MAYNMTHRLSGNNKAVKMFGWKVSELKLEVPTVFCSFLPLRFECVGRLQASMLHLHLLMVSLTLLHELVWTVPISCFLLLVGCCCCCCCFFVCCCCCCCCCFVSGRLNISWKVFIFLPSCYVLGQNHGLVPDLNFQIWNRLCPGVPVPNQ